MACILLVDPTDIARKAMKGIVARGGHRLAAVSSVADAWDFLQRNPVVDLVFLELKLEGESGIELLRRLRADLLLSPMPVVVYTAAGDRDAVRRAMELKVQNFLIKPYHDEPLLAEVRKALADPWRLKHFEEEKSFCAMMGYTREGLHKILADLQTSVAAASALLIEQAQLEHVPPIIAKLKELADAAEAAGAWGVVEVVNAMREAAKQRQWPVFQDGIKALGFAEKLIFRHINPTLIPPDFIADTEREQAEQAARRAQWLNARAENRLPVIAAEKLFAEVATLGGCPVIDSIGASFQMSATGHPSSLAPLMDLAEKDPGLAAHLLFAANHLRRNEDLDPEPLESPRIAVNLLGEIKLAAMSGKLLIAEEKHIHLPPCSWMGFWMFQKGVARMARYTCRYLEFNSLESRAYVGGLIHDIGKLILLHLHPYAFEAVLDCARSDRITLAEAEQRILGCTTRELAAHFARHHGLLANYEQVMRWHHAPAQAPVEHAVLVASVSLARELCRQNRVGWTGDLLNDCAKPIAETPGWQILRERIFPSFNLEKFEAEAHAECRELKQQLHGRYATAAA